MSNKTKSQLEAELKAVLASERRWRLLVEQGDAIAMVSADGIILYESPAAERILGYTPTELKGMNAFALLYPDDQEIAARYFEQILSLPGQPVISQMRFIRKDGSICWVESTIINRLNDPEFNAIVINSRDVTERKKMDELLREKENRFRSFMEQSADGFLLTDEQGVIIEWNQAISQITGLTREQALGMSLWEMQYLVSLAENRPVITIEYLRSYVQGILHSGQVPQLLGKVNEIKLQTLQGERKVIQQNAFIVRTDRGICVGATLRDITSQKLAEEKLRESEDKFKYVFEHSNVGNSITQINGDVYVNQAFCDMLGYARDELKGKRWQDISHPDDIESTQKEVDDLVSGKKAATRFSKRYIRKDGTVAWVDLSSVARRDENGNLLYLMSSLVDITERKQAESQRESALEKLRESEQKFSILFQKSPVAISLARMSDNRIVDINEAFEKLTGLDRSEIIGKNTLELGMVADLESRKRLIAQLKANGYARDIEYKLVTESRGECAVLLNIDIIEINGQKHAISMVQDITERKQAQQNLLDSQKKLQALVTSLDDIVFEVDEHGTYLNVWTADETMLFQPPEHIIGRRFDDIFGAEASRPFFEFLEYCLDSGQMQNLEYPVELPGGKRWFNARFNLIRSGTEKPKTVSILVRDITERKDAEKALQESQVKFYDLFKNLPMQGSIYKLIRNEQGEIADWEISDINPLGAASLGSVAEDLIGQRALGLFGNEIMGPYLDISRQVASNGKPLLFETRFDANRKEYLSSAFMVGREHYATISVDITDRKLAEEKLRASEARFRTLFEASHAIMLIVDPASGVIIDANLAAAEFYGYSRAQLINMNINDISQINPQEASTEWMQAISNQQNYFVIPHRLAGGEVRTVEVRASRIELNNQVMLFSIISDITARKQAELQKDAALNKLRTSEEKFRLIAETIEEVFWMFDNQHMRMEYVSPAYEKVWGRTVKSLYEDGRQYIEAILPEDRQVMFDALERQARGEQIDMEYRIIRPDGSFRWIHDRSFPILDESGMVLRTTGIAIDITDQKKGELALRESHETAQAILNAASESVFLMDIDGTVVAANETTAARLGKQVQDLIGANMFSLLPPAVADGRKKQLEMVVRNRKFVEFEDERFGMWMESNIYPIFDVDGNVRRVAVFGRDITNRKLAEDKLRENEHRMRLAVETTNIGIWAWNLKTNTIQWDTEMFRMYGIEPSTDGVINYIDWSSAVNPKELVEQEAALQDTIHRRGQGKREFQIRRRDSGELRYIYAVESVRLNSAGEPELVVGTNIDITERKKAEEKLRASEEKYRSLSQELEQRVKERTADVYTLSERLELATRAANLGVWNWSVKTNQLQWDDQMFVIHRVDKASFAGNLEFVMRTIHLDDVEMVRQKIQELLSGMLESGVIEYRIMRGDGCIGYLKTHGVAQYNAGNQIENVIGMVQDVTEEKLAEQAMRESRDNLDFLNRKLERASRAKDEFLANMSHELRTPLNGILGMSEILLSGQRGPLNERQNIYVSTIYASGQHLLSLINDVLDLAKIEADKLELYVEAVSVSNICHACLAFIKEPAAKKDVQIGLKISEDVTTIQADERRLKQILVNLLNNAVKFTPPEGKISLEVQPNRQKKCVEFSVIDTGIGISPEDQQRLFTPFVQADNSLTRKYEGTGLGLALVKRLSELHGGSVSLESELGKGSRFTVSLPWQDTEPSKTASDKTVNAAIETLPTIDRKNKATILLAEDNPINAMTIADYLDGLGYSMVIANDGYEALNKAIESIPDLILMDVQMPDLDGLEATRRLRTDPQFAFTPIIAITAQAMVGDREKCLAAGANAYMSKPISLKKLQEIIRGLLEQDSRQVLDDDAL